MPIRIAICYNMLLINPVTINTMPKLLFYYLLILFLANPLATSADEPIDIFARDNLVAWCIVPFDGKHRGPAERAAMCAKLGIKRVAYDWRAEHVATFEQEILEYKKHGLEYFAFWAVHEEAFKLFEKHKIAPQIWFMLPQPPAGTQLERVKVAAENLLSLLARAKAMGSKVGLYNHGGWSGEPENMVAVCNYLQQHHEITNVGIVYNQHHSHHRIDDFDALLKILKPHLLCLNLNGMTRGGEANGRKILPLGVDVLDVKLLRLIRDSQYDGPIGIIGHTQDDVEQRLLDNLEGLDWIRPQLDGKPATKRPPLRTPIPPLKATRGVKSVSTEADLPPDTQRLGAVGDYSVQLVNQMLVKAMVQGDAARGMMLFANSKTACLNCHKLGETGGTVGPAFSKLGQERKPAEIVESMLWPKRVVKPEYEAHAILTIDGKALSGYVKPHGDDAIELHDPSRDADQQLIIPLRDIEAMRKTGTLMPENLLATYTYQQLFDLIRFVTELGTPQGLPLAEIEPVLQHALAHSHGPALFEITPEPLDKEANPYWQAEVNRDRFYDFYAKEAEHFRGKMLVGEQVPPVLMAFPGLDGGDQGHWGNQNEETWASDDWNHVVLGRVQSGVFRDGAQTIIRSVCVQLGKDRELSCVFDPETLTYRQVWRGKFLKFSEVRHGFLGGVMMAGEAVAFSENGKTAIAAAEIKTKKYRGFYRNGDRVVFVYEINGDIYRDSPWVVDGKFQRSVSLAVLTANELDIEAPQRIWQRTLQSNVEHGDQKPYATDTLKLPRENPWNVPFFGTGIGFLSDGSALLATMHGDVWRITNYEYPSRQATWQRFASGLHQPLGIVVGSDGVFVICRDQLTRLVDRNGDGEADFYECFSNQFATSAGGHDYICGLERDAEGNFYTAVGGQGVLKISADGAHTDIIATGFRNADGLGLTADGILTVPCAEGTWTPASMICGVRLGQQRVGHFGFPGPHGAEVPDLPLVYLPRGVDNQAGGQQLVPSKRWGPFTGQLLHFSFGTGKMFLVLRDDVSGQMQGAVVPLPGDFLSGTHRGRFSPFDGQLYVTGMQGWGSYTPTDGCFQRVRYRGGNVQQPLGIHTYRNGVIVRFSEKIDETIASEIQSHFAMSWNYRYGGQYGSPEYSGKHFGMQGHDYVAIKSASVVDDGRSLFLEIPDLQPVNQLYLRLQIGKGQFRELFVTVHALDEKSFIEAEGLVALDHKPIASHPILADLALATRKVPNPYVGVLADARAIEIQTGSNLSFQTRSFQVNPGERIALTLKNPDVVPHNWALLAPGTLREVGDLTNKLISDPDAMVRQYIPQTKAVLAYTDIVLPRESFTIYFTAPTQSGNYPYLCTFPGHWLVMNGEMRVR